MCSGLFPLQLAQWPRLPPPGCLPQARPAPYWSCKGKNCSWSVSLQECERELKITRYTLSVGIFYSIFNATVSSSCVKPCLSSSRPTPRITWTKDGEDLVVTSPKKVKNFNKMIQIPKASFDDAGEYVCTAANKIGYIEHTITVRVKGERHFQKHVVFSYCAIMLKQLTYLYLTAAPFWLEKPADLVLAPEENGRLVCRSDGVPRPTIRWFVNGEPIESKILEFRPTSC